MNRRWKYPLKLAFFGLTPEYKQSMHGAIFMLCYKVPGFSHTEVYNMPCHLRSYYIKEYTEWRKAENETAENAQQGQEAAYQQYVNTQQNPE